jgi:hypothetical protein
MFLGDYDIIHDFITTRFSLKNRLTTLKKISMGKIGDYAKILTTQLFQKMRHLRKNENCVIKFKKLKN